jgi:hypothetical protein
MDDTWITRGLSKNKTYREQLGTVPLAIPQIKNSLRTINIIRVNPFNPCHPCSPCVRPWSSGNWIVSSIPVKVQIHNH